MAEHQLNTDYTTALYVLHAEMPGGQVLERHGKPTAECTVDDLRDMIPVALHALTVRSGPQAELTADQLEMAERAHEVSMNRAYWVLERVGKYLNDPEMDGQKRTTFSAVLKTVEDILHGEILSKKEKGCTEAELDIAIHNARETYDVISDNEAEVAATMTTARVERDMGRMVYLDDKLVLDGVILVTALREKTIRIPASGRETPIKLGGLTLGGAFEPHPDRDLY